MTDRPIYVLTNAELEKAILTAHWHSQHTGSATEAYRTWNATLAGLTAEQVRRARAAKEAT